MTYELTDLRSAVGAGDACASKNPDSNGHCRNSNLTLRLNEHIQFPPYVGLVRLVWGPFPGQLFFVLRSQTKHEILQNSADHLHLSPTVKLGFSTFLGSGSGLLTPSISAGLPK